MTRRARSTAWPAAARRPVLFRHIMVPVDLSDRNERALRAALDLARERRGRTTLFHVIERVAGIAPGELGTFYQRLVESSERRLRRTARKFLLGADQVLPRADLLLDQQPLALVLGLGDRVHDVTCENLYGQTAGEELRGRTFTSLSLIIGPP